MGITAEPPRGQGAAALATWLDNHKHTASWLAEQLDVSKAAVHGWLHKGAIPEAYHRERIEEVTGGAVPARLFSQDDRARREAAKRSPEAP